MGLEQAAARAAAMAASAARVQNTALPATVARAERFTEMVEASVERARTSMRNRGEQVALIDSRSTMSLTTAVHKPNQLDGNPGLVHDGLQGRARRSRKLLRRKSQKSTFLTLGMSLLRLHPTAPRPRSSQRLHPACRLATMTTLTTFNPLLRPGQPLHRLLQHRHPSRNPTTALSRLQRPRPPPTSLSRWPNLRHKTQTSTISSPPLPHPPVAPARRPQSPPSPLHRKHGRLSLQVISPLDPTTSPRSKSNPRRPQVLQAPA